MKKKTNNLYKRRIKILEYAKKHILFDGWNEKIFHTISKELKISSDEIAMIFSNDYKNLLKLYLDSLENKMIEAVNRVDLSYMSTYEKIIQIICIRLEQSIKEKELVRKTFKTLMLPQNAILASSLLYKTVNNIWYLAGDKSTDFNFYTKRSILAGIYLSTIIYWINDESKDLDKTKEFLIKLLNKTNLISKFKKSIKIGLNNLNSILKFKENFKY